MGIKKIDGSLFKTLVINGAENLKANYQSIDALNVFPVPDGDTGTNMKMTIDGGVNEIYNFDEKNIEEMAKKISRGMLMGARGNSGVILSQLFRGIYKGFAGCKEVNAIGLAKAFDSGVKQAYKAVMKPVEGTILTVAREAAEKMTAISNSRMTIEEFFDEYIQEAKASLERTPELLPVLKEAGVVDSGGAGFICILEGMQMALEGKFVSDTPVVHSNIHSVSTNILNNDSHEEFGYCTEFILQLPKDKVDVVNEEDVLKLISPLGNSIVCVKDEDIIKVHIHTLKPGDVLNCGQTFGEFVHLKIENMTIQHHENQELKKAEAAHEEQVVVKKPETRKKYAIVSVASGKGLINTFMEMGADYVVTGGQTMNPSTEDFIKGFDTLNADHILVFPNNKNIVLAAKQAAKIYTESKVHVVETKTIAQGFSALTMIDLNGEPEDIIADLYEVIEKCTTGTITYAVRDTTVDGIKIRKDDFMGFKDGKIVCSHRRKLDSVKKLLEACITEDKEIVTIIYGSDVKEKDVAEVKKHIERNFSNVEVDVIEGNQEVYSYIFSIE